MVSVAFTNTGYGGRPFDNWSVVMFPCTDSPFDQILAALRRFPCLLQALQLSTHARCVVLTGNRVLFLPPVTTLGGGLQTSLSYSSRLQMPKEKHVLNHDQSAGLLPGHWDRLRRLCEELFMNISEKPQASPQERKRSVISKRGIYS